MSVNTFEIRENKIQTEDDWFFPSVTQDWKFYDLDMKEHKKMLQFPNREIPNAIFQNKFYLS